MTAWRARLAGAGADRPVLIEGDAATTKAAMIATMRSVGHPVDYLYVDGERWTTDDVEPIGESNFRNGAILSENGAADDQLEPGTYLVVVGGPGAGRSVRLQVGQEIIVGRNPGPGGVEIVDPLLSSQHLRIEMADDGSVEASDLGSKNGSAYEGAAFATTLIEIGCLVHVGASLLAIVELGADDRATLLGETPTGLNIHRQFREAVSEMPDPPTPPKKPKEDDPHSGSPWWRSLTPLVTGVGMAIMFDRWAFLLIAAFAPIIYLVDNQRRKKARKRDQAEELAKYETDLAAHHIKMSKYRATEVRRARTSQPGGGLCAVLARYGHRRVWERRPADDDFLSVTLGYATLASALVSRDEAKSESRPTLWQAPLTISLIAEGPLSITGPMERATAVARSLLIELVFAHAPVDFNLWVFSDDSRAADWDFVQWVPHAFTDDGGARLGVTAPARSSLMQALRGLIETRQEEADGKAIFPMQIVVIDGVDNLAAPDLTEILRHGPEVGVIGIVTDPSVVPEGIRGEVQLGRFDDECSFRSVLTPRVDDVTVSQLSRALALDAALALAPLEAFSKATTRPISQVFFTEMIGFGDRTPEEQIGFWRQHSPQERVPVGVTMDGEQFNIDFVGGGPHGLIGGMTRSGKTEFLKTWFSSLALHNHPSDLAIAIIDFKGGVDHQQTAELPHVVALATNQNIDLFERTVTLLTAEHERREHIFLHEAGVATIEGYRTARRSRPDLPPIPRLLVVVDEFAELLDTPEGKMQVGRLESIARIGAGLGVHLLLLTQLFSNGLPPTIDAQAGLRVCFKVQNGSDSKFVIKSAAAAGISSSTKGRAMARFQGGDLIEFQSARVGNEARNKVVSDGHLAAHFVTVESLTRPPTPPEHREVPNEEQDLFRIVQLARQAAAREGLGEQYLPWPDDLPLHLELSDLVEQHGFDRSLLIGIADDPEHQRVLPVRHAYDDAVVALAGSAGSGHHDTLTTIALAAAMESSPNDLHIYGIDLVGQGLSLLAPLPHVGTIATRDDATAMRILSWLVTESAARRAVIARQGASDFDGYRRLGGDQFPQIVLFVLGADRMFLHGEGTVSPLLGSMTTVVNEVAGTGIQVVFSGSLPMLANRLGTTATRRLVFRANDPAEYPATVPKALRAQLTAAGRFVDSSSGLLSHAAVVAAGEVSAGDVLTAVGDALEQRQVSSRAPRKFTKAPWPLQMRDIRAADLATPTPGIEVPLPFGVQPDSGELIWLDPSEDGTAYRFVGPPKSGRSNALGAVGVMAAQTGWRVIVAAASKRSTLLTVEQLADWIVPIDRVVEMVAEGVSMPTLLLMDDVHRLDDEFPWKKIAGVESPSPLVTMVAGSTEALSRTIQRALNAPNGVTLMPNKTREAQSVGVGIIDDEWVINPLAGVGVAGIAGEAHRVQFPLVVDIY